MNLKKIHLGWMLLLPAITAFSQGNVNFNNNFQVPGSIYKACICGLDGRAVPRGTWQVEVLDSAGGLIKSGAVALNGLFFLGVIDIPGTTPGGPGSVILRAWEGPPGSNYDSAVIKSAAVITLIGLGGGAIPPPALATAGNFTGIRPLHVPVASLLRNILTTWEGLAIFGEGCPLESEWALEASTDLVNWEPAGAPQIADNEISQGLWFGVRWDIPEPDTSAFYRMTWVR